MVANRQDAWTTEDDLLLAEVTLRHIREGGTQLQAFEEVAEKMGRTSAACGFRWNSFVRKKYVQAIAIAKAQRQKNKQSRTIYVKNEEVSNSAPITMELEEEISFDTIIRYLKTQKTREQEWTKKIRSLEQSVKEKDEELSRLREENQRMQHEYSSAKTVNDDYRALVQIMDRARKIAILGTEQEEAPVFKMDPNGNLERIFK